MDADFRFIGYLLGILECFFTMATWPRQSGFEISFLMRSNI